MRSALIVAATTAALVWTSSFRARAAGAFDDPPEMTIELEGRSAPAVIVKVRVRTGVAGASDFRLHVFARGAQEPVTTLRASAARSVRDTTEALSIGVLVQDALANIPAVRSAIQTIADGGKDGTHVGVWIYGRSNRSAQPLLEAGSLRLDALDDASAPPPDEAAPRSSLTEGVLAAVTALAGRPGRRVLFIIGDGSGAEPREDGRDGARDLKASEIETHVIALANRGLDDVAARRLHALAIGGGVAIAPHRDQVPQIAWLLTQGIQDRYEVVFEVPGEQAVALFDGSTRPVALAVKDEETEPVAVTFPRSTSAPDSSGGRSLASDAVVAGALAAGLLLAGVASLVVLRRARRRRARRDEPAPAAVTWRSTIGR